MWQQIKNILVKLLNRKYFTTTDPPYKDDFGCKVEGYVDKHGKFYILKTQYYK